MAKKVLSALALAAIAAMAVMIKEGKDEAEIQAECVNMLGDEDASAETVAALYATAKKQAEQTDEEIPKDMKSYLDNYPDNDVFYRTSDKQVFLKENKQWAVEHQKTLKGGEIETFVRPK